jgi:hypothetical protein
MHDPADDPTIIDLLYAPNIRRQMRLDPNPLLVAQPKQVCSHDPDSPSQANQNRMESGLRCFGTKINELRP